MTVGHLLDDAFLAIIKEWTELTTSCAEGAVTSILKNSGEYLSNEQQKAVQDFHDLYFGGGDVVATKEAMNREVDDLVDAIQNEMAGGGDVSKLSAVKEDEDAKRSRLSLSGVQKQLETIIQLETGLKEKLVPVLTNMQFEDAIKQRLSRMVQAWNLSLEAAPETSQEAMNLGELIGKTLGSAVERRAFYPSVLQREAPKDAIEDMSLFDALK
jgi:hypothetical protein